MDRWMDRTDWVDEEMDRKERGKKGVRGLPLLGSA